MGDMFSSKKNTTSSATTNQQVALQAAPGSGQLGISGSSINASPISVVSSDPDVTIEALRQMGMVTDSNALVAVNSTNAALQTSIRSLETLQNVTARAGDSVDNAVMLAQETALRATPISGGEVIAASQQANNELLVKGALILVGGLAAMKLLKN